MAFTIEIFHGYRIVLRCSFDERPSAAVSALGALKLIEGDQPPWNIMRDPIGYNLRFIDRGRVGLVSLYNFEDAVVPFTTGKYVPGSK